MTSRRRRTSRTKTTSPTQVTQVPDAPTTESSSTSRQARIARYTEMSSGPIPPPLMLKGYENIQEGLADRIVAMAERQEAHRQRMENKVITGDGWRAWAGLGCALLVSVLTIGGGVDLGLHRPDVAGTVLSGIFGVGGLTGLAGTFVYGTRMRQNERMQKAQIMTRRSRR